MAYLGNTLINGSLRCLNKAYFNDLSVSGTTSFANLDVSGKTTTNQLVVNNFNNPSTLSSTNSSTGNIPVVIGNPNGKHIAIDGDEIAAKNGATTASDMWLNYGGGAVYLGSGGLTYLRNNVFVAPTLNSTTSTITTGNITTLNASTVTADNVTVNNVLKSSKWDISNVANLANDFMVAPTIKISSSGTVTIASLNTTTKTCRLIFSDSSQINSDEFGGCRWYAGSKVRVTFTVSGTLNSNIEGTIVNNMNTTAGTLVIDVTLDNITGLANGTYNATDATIMLYEIASGSNLYPVGIRMTAYGTNNSSYIDMYGGTASTDYTHPIVRIGRLNGITFNDKTFGTNELPAAWGIYTLNGYFEGAVVAKEGKIGEWIIDSKKIYTGTWGSNNSAMMSPGTTSTDGNKSIGGSDSISGWTFTSGANFGVNKDGSLYANKGKIGGWNIGSNAITNGTWGAANSAMVCTGSSTAKIIGGSESISGWTFTSGANFGVTKTGALYANDVNISGAVNATALHVGSSSSTNHLIYENSTIDLQTDWLKFDSSTNTVIIGKDNAPRVNIDGQSMSLTDKDDNVYFKIGDMRVNGMYVFTTSKPDIVVTGVDHDHTPSYYADASCDIDENYDVKVFDEDDVELEYSSISHIELYGKTIGRVWLTKTSLVTNSTIKLTYTTTSGIYNFRYGDRSTSRSDGVFSVCFSKDGETNGSYAFAVGKFTEASGVASFSSGLHSKSTGEYSHAEGYYTEALDSCSHAEGFRTVANGAYSHAEGCDSVAHDFANHAEGYECHAYNGGAGHAEGWGTKSYGNGAHSEGWYTVAVGAYSHAEGYYTRADGYGSHTSGTYTKATRDYQTVIGKYNANHSTNTIFDAGDYAFIIGNGTANNSASRSNALTVDWNGNLWCAGKVNNVDLYCISTEGTLASSNYQTAIGKYNVEDTNNTYALIIGNGTNNNNRSNALTVDWTGSVATGNDVTASGESSIATGCETVASGFYSHAEGLYSVASNTCSHASGEGTYATAANQTTIGKYNAVTIDSTFDPPLYDAGSTYAFIIGNGTADDARSNALTVDWNGCVKSHDHFLSQKSEITIGTTPSVSHYSRAFGLMDSVGYPYADIQHTYATDGYSGVTFCVNRDVNGTTKQNFFRMLVGADGTNSIRFSDPTAWKNGLGVQLNVKQFHMGQNRHLTLSSSSTYPTFLMYGTGGGTTPFMASIILTDTSGGITVADNKANITGSGKYSGYTLTFPANWFQVTIISYYSFNATVSA